MSKIEVIINTDSVKAEPSVGNDMRAKEPVIRTQRPSPRNFIIQSMDTLRHLRGTENIL